MMKYVILVLAIVAFASAQIVYSGYNAANLHGPYAASTSTGIRRFGATGGILTTGYAAPVAPYAAYAF